MLKRGDRQFPLKIYDCFSSRRFGGNVGGVVLEAGGLADGDMQAIAGEINAPVTGFVTTLDDEALHVRFFMPNTEIPMCGHVAVGLYSYLHEQGLTGPEGAEPPVMKTRAGDISVSITLSPGNDVVVMMDLALATNETGDFDRAAIAQALCIDEGAITADFPIEIGSTGMRHLFVPITNLETVKTMEPDFPALTKLSHRLNVSTVAAFSLRTDDPVNTLHCRDFCPAVGVNEVPASGTTNSALACYLVRNRLIEPIVSEGELTILVEQGSELNRPSIVQVKVGLNDAEITRISVGGCAVLTIDGFVNA